MSTFLYSNIKVNQVINLEGQLFGEHYIEHIRNDKFSADQVFFNNDDYLIITCGLIVNLAELKDKYRVANLESLILFLYKAKQGDFFSEFRGSFSGIIIDKLSNKVLSFSDHLSTHPIYYYFNNSELIISNKMQQIVSYIKRNKRPLSLNLDAAYSLLSLGYQLNDNTITNEIKRVKPGDYLSFNQNQVKIETFYKISSKRIEDMPYEKIIDRLDELFRKSVKRALDKDAEYGYKHFIALSGGLDSRMTTWVANDLGYGERIVNFTFSQSNHLDESIPKKISADLKHEWLFKALDNGTFLSEIDDGVSDTLGGCLYSGYSGGKSMLNMVNFDNIGLIHSGQLGDVIIGSFIKDARSNEWSDKICPKQALKSIAYSDALLSRITNFTLDKTRFKTPEEFYFFYRGLLGTNQGLSYIKNYTETYSPFYDIDFLDFCFSIPLKYRSGHKLYFDWVKKKYPKAANYVWEKYNTKITSPFVRIKGRILPYKSLPSYLLKLVLTKLGFKFNYYNKKNNMNPFDYWYDSNQDLKVILDGYYDKHIKLLGEFPKLQEDCKELYENYGVIEKTQVLTLLSTYKSCFKC